MLNEKLCFCLAAGAGLVFASSTWAQVNITEFMAADNDVLADEDGDYPDWIEIHNAETNSVNLNGWYLTDNPAQLTKWRFPTTDLAANAYLIVFASGKNRAVAGNPLHASFSLKAEGEYLGLVQTNGVTIASEFAPEFPEQLDDYSYGIYQGTNYYFATPTPRASNVAGFVARVADTKFDHDRGFYETNFSLVITTATASATIRYTTNGSPPTATNGIVYTAPIFINRTLVIRAAAFRSGFLPSNVDTHTYLFLNDVIYQSPNGAPPPGWPSKWGDNKVDYGMDPNVVNAAPYSGTIKDDLKSVPSLCLVTDLNNLFNSSTGIYANPWDNGPNWERPASLELILPDGQPGFQIETGLRIRGGFSRDPHNPKHSFRCILREEYGDSKLDYELFGPDGDDTIDKIDLRTAQDNSWAFQGDINGTFLPDSFSRDTLLAMGRPGTRGDFYHLYINGQYWGLYNTEERPEEEYAASYFGGQPEEYDVVKVEAGPYDVIADNGTLDAWFRLWQAATNGFASAANYQRVQGNNPDGTPNPAYEVLLDVPNLIDYMLVIVYTGNYDGPVYYDYFPNNFYALRNRNRREGFRFVTHDAELCLTDVNYDRTQTLTVGDPAAGSGFSESNPQYVWQRLQANAEFRLLVADHVHRFLFNGGVLTTQACAARYAMRTNEIFRALVGESARWGDADREPAITRSNWVKAVTPVLTNYFPKRSGIVLNQLRARGLYPTNDAPRFNQHGGLAPAGFHLTMSVTNGAIYYTLDGTDPRLPGGAISSTAQVYTNPVVITESAPVKARARAGTSWSALNEAAFYVAQSLNGLLVTEIMYHPPDTTNAAGEEYEFIELKNASGRQLDLSGARFTNGIRFEFAVGTKLPAGEFMVLVSNPEKFALKYPAILIAGAYSGHLANSGETVALVDVIGSNVFTMVYDDKSPWPASPDGIGSSLAPVNPNLNPDPNDPSNWRASTFLGGSPGADDPPLSISPILINEALTHTDPPVIDSIELHNPTTTNVDIGNWYLTDDRTEPQKFRIPPFTEIPAGGYMVFTESDWNSNPSSPKSFRLDSHGEEIYLYSGDAGGQLTGYSDGFAFGAAQNGISFGRYVNSMGEVQYPAQRRNTLGTHNAGPRIGPVVINEIQYHPAVGDDEFIELKSVTNGVVKLYDPDYPTNTWRLNGVAYSFPTNTEIAANGLLLLVPMDPAAFRTKYNVPSEVPIHGPYSGVLQDGGETLSLQRCDQPDSDTNTGSIFIPYIDVDVVRYDDQVSWLTNAGGGGPSLERIAANAYGNDPINWRESPGQASPGVENNGFTDWKAQYFTPAELADPAISGDLADADDDSHNNWQEFITGTNPRDAQSVLRLEVVAGSGGPLICFQAEVGKSYSVLYTTSLMDGPWLNLTNIQPSGSAQIIEIPDVLTDETHYYRVITPQTP